MKNNKWKYRIYAAAFVIVLATPGLLTLVGKKDPSSEKHALFSDTLSAADFPTSFNDYFSSQFYFRKNLISSFYSLRIFSLRETYLDDKVVVGEQGWLYYSPDTDGYGISDYTGKVILSKQQLEKIAQHLEEQHLWLKRKGVKYLVVVCPNKQTIYPEYFPDSMAKGKTVLDQVMDYLTTHSDVPFLDLRNVLLEEKRKNRFSLYYKTDTHWNSIGAYVASQKIFQKLGGGFIPMSINDCSVSSNPCNGRDIPKMIGLESYYEEEDFQLTWNRKNYSILKKPKAVVFHDSYYGHLRPYFQAQFDTVVTRPHFWTPFDHGLIEEEKPDYVIYEMVERYIGALLRENPASLQKAATQTP